MTLPTLIANYQKQMYVNGLKKQYSLWSNTFKSILSSEGVDSLADTSVFQAIPAAKNHCNYVSYNSNCDDFYDKLSKYTKISLTELKKTYVSSIFDGSSTLIGYGKNNMVIMTPDNGMLVNYYFFRLPGSNISCEETHLKGGKLCKCQGYFNIDVNGLKGPNKRGRDVFTFYISDDGNLYPYGGKDVAIYQKADYNTWDTMHKYCGLPEGSGSIIGNGCAARVMAEGWQMNY